MKLTTPLPGISFYSTRQRWNVGSIQYRPMVLKVMRLPCVTLTQM